MPLVMLSNGSVRTKRLNLSPKICVMRRAAAERFARYNSANATVSMAETVDLKLLFQIYRLKRRKNMNKDNIPDELKTYTVAEAASLIGIKKDTIYEYLRAGKLPCLKMGHTRIRHEALVEFLRNMETTQYWD